MQFRPAPDRWAIIRRVHGKPQLEKRVLVESNCIRTINDPELGGSRDIDLDTCPAMDPDRPVAEQPLLRMGRARTLTKENADIAARQEQHRAPFNAFEMGHEFFPDYAPHNMGALSYFDDLSELDAAGAGVGDGVYDVTYWSQRLGRGYRSNGLP